MGIPILLFMAVGQAGAQHVLTVRDSKGLAIQAHSLSRVVAGANVLYLLEKNVRVDSARQGLSLKANSVAAKTIADANSKKGELLSTATATGQVALDKSVTTSQGKQTTHITGSKADFADGATESTVKMTGPVTIHSVDSAGAQNLSATGASGIAYLERLNSTASDTGLKRAILKGSVHMTIDRHKTAKQKALALQTTSDQATVENIGQEQRITLTGNVHLIGPDAPPNSGIQRAVITIEKDGTMNLQAASS